MLVGTSSIEGMFSIVGRCILMQHPVIFLLRVSKESLCTSDFLQMADSLRSVGAGNVALSLAVAITPGAPARVITPLRTTGSFVTAGTADQCTRVDA